MALKIPIPGRNKETSPGESGSNGNGAAPEESNGAAPTRAEKVAKAKELTVHHGTAAAKNTTD